MEKTPESLAQEIAAMREQLSKVSKAIDVYESVATGNLDKEDTQSKGEISQKHVELFVETDRLMKKVRGPVDMVFSNFENVSLKWSRNEKEKEKSLFLHEGVVHITMKIAME